MTDPCPKDSDGMEASGLIERVHDLTDLELAMLLCLAANEHCIIEYDQKRDELLEQELQLIASHVFGLSCSVICCSEKTTLEDITNGLLVDEARDETGADAKLKHASDVDNVSIIRDSTVFSKDPTPKSPVLPDNERRGQRLVNVIVVAGLTMADEQIQIQFLELLRTRRMFTHTEVHAAPKPFLVVLLQPSEEGPLVHHLIDNIFISHHHDPGNGYSNVADLDNVEDNDALPGSSVVHHSKTSRKMIAHSSGVFPSQVIKMITDLSQRVTITAEVKAYLHNLIVFLRLNRAVAKGVSPVATKHLDRLSRILTIIHGQSFTTPAIIGLAFRKVYRHRVQITSADFERSMQYGSHPRMVESILDGLKVDTILENVLQEVEVPV